MTNTESSDDPQQPCADKMAFDTQKEAVAAGTAAEWQYGGALKAYRCQHCKLWHLATRHHGA